MDSNRTFSVLFLCTGNSARSIMAEAVLNEAGRGRFTPSALAATPQAVSIRLRWKCYVEIEFGRRVPEARTGPNSLNRIPPARLRHYGCDKAAAEVCPVWPGQPMSAHWGVPDPAAAEGDEGEI